MGIDPSLSSTGWAFRLDDGRVVTGRIETDKLRGPWRLHYAVTQLEKIVMTYRPTLVVYEDYAMGARGNTFHMGELGGVFKRMLWFAGVSYLEVSPTMLKKVITGAGRAKAVKGRKLTESEKKQPMISALRDEFGLHINQHDEADAAGLMLLGEMKCGVNPSPQKTLISRRLDAVRELAVVRGKLQSISNPPQCP